MNELEIIIEKQKIFQREVGFPIDSSKESDRNEMSEKYLFKAIEEIVELRKEFPSTMNPWSKSQKMSDITKIKEEFSDVILFLLNFAIVWKISIEDVLSQIKLVQENNFNRMKIRKMDQLNREILSVPTLTSGVGQGNLTPKYIFVGQNPGQDIPHGYKFWSNQEDGSSAILLPIIEKLGIKDDCYFTNIVKSTTPGNAVPDDKTTEFWESFLIREINLLRLDNPGCKIIGLGQYVNDYSTKKLHYWEKVSHPGYVLRGGITIEEYAKEIEEAVKF